MNLSVLWKRAQNNHFHKDGTVEKSNATPIKLNSVDSYDLKTISFKFGNDIFITFEMPGSSYKRPVGKFNISLLFCPIASEVLGFMHDIHGVEGHVVKNNNDWSWKFEIRSSWTRISLHVLYHTVDTVLMD